MFVSDKSTLVEVIVGKNGIAPGANSKTYFDPQPLLQSFAGGQTVFIDAIELVPPTALASSPITSGTPNATVTNIINATLTLVSEGQENQQFIPLANTCRVWDNAAASAPHTWQPWVMKRIFAVDWTKCYVQTIAVPAVVPFAFLITFHYSILRT